jgi:hypothetical protein
MIPKFAVKLPSDNREVTFRSFLVKEEKALLLAVEAGDSDTIMRAIKDAISACCDDLDVSKVPYFDIEYLFLNLRAKSIGETVKFNYRHSGGKNRAGDECAAATEVSIKVDEIGIKRDSNHNNRFMIDDRLGLKMTYPTLDSIQKFTGDDKNELALMASCIEYVYDAENVFPPDTLDEAVGFVEQMNTKQYEKIAEFFETMPKLSHELTYSCDGCGQVDTVKFEGVADFF